MAVIFLEDFPHGTDDLSGFMAYEYALKFPGVTVHLLPVLYDKKLDNNLNNLIIVDRICPYNNDLCFCDLSTYYGRYERKIDSSGLPIIGFTLINNLKNHQPLFSVGTVINADLNKIINEEISWRKKIKSLDGSISL